LTAVKGKRNKRPNGHLVKVLTDDVLRQEAICIKLAKLHQALPSSEQPHVRTTLC